MLFFSSKFLESNCIQSRRRSTLERIGSDFNLGLRVTGGLTFGPKQGEIDKGSSGFSQPQSNKQYIDTIRPLPKYLRAGPAQDTANTPPSVCVPAVIGALTVWIQKPNPHT